MKYLPILLALLLPLSANAVVQGTPATLNCMPPTHYENGEAITDDVLTYSLYRDGEPEGATASECRFTVETITLSGDYVYQVTATSAKFGTESVLSNSISLTVEAVTSPNAPTQLNWE
jgi:hypothetical protein